MSFQPILFSYLSFLLYLCVNPGEYYPQNFCNLFRRYHLCSFHELYCLTIFLGRIYIQGGNR